jgi:hypothetical protein
MTKLILILFLVLIVILGMAQYDMLVAIHVHSQMLREHEQVIQRFHMQQGVAKPSIEDN